MIAEEGISIEAVTGAARGILAHLRVLFTIPHDGHIELGRYDATANELSLVLPRRGSVCWASSGSKCWPRLRIRLVRADRPLDTIVRSDDRRAFLRFTQVLREASLSVPCVCHLLICNLARRLASRIALHGLVTTPVGEDIVIQ